MEAKLVIENLSKLNLSAYPVEEIRRLIYTLDISDFILVKLKKGRFVYRIRIDFTKKDINNVNEEMNSLPGTLNYAYKRASTPDIPMFYGWMAEEKPKLKLTAKNIIESIEIPDLIIDKKRISKQSIVISKWKFIDDVDIIAVMSTEVLKNICRLDNSFFLAYEDFNQKTSEKKAIQLTNYFAKEFSKKRVNKEYYFLISALFTEYIVKQGISGVVYQNVRRHRSGFKISLNPLIARNSLQLISAKEYLVTKENNFFNYRQIF